jgi:hypothetical protein
VTATDHSVAAGHDINGDVANGNGNVVGDNNTVGNTVHSDDHSIKDSFNSTNLDYPDRESADAAHRGDLVPRHWADFHHVPALRSVHVAPVADVHADVGDR